MALFETESCRPVSRLVSPGGGDREPQLTQAPFKFLLAMCAVPLLVTAACGSDYEGDVLSDRVVSGASITTDDRFVYWTDSRGRLQRVPKTGGTSETLADDKSYASPLSSLAVSSGTAYWSTLGAAGGVISAQSLDGGPEMTIATHLPAGDMNPWTIAVDATDLYFGTFAGAEAARYGLYKVPLTGGATTRVAQGPVVDFVLEGANVHYVVLENLSPPTGPILFRYTVRSAPRAGGDPITLASGSDQVHFITAGGGHLFWSAEGREGTITSLRLPDGPPTSFAAGQDSLSRMATDGVNVYWAANGAVMRAPVDGGKPVRIASRAPYFTGPLAVDSTSVYWFGADNTLRKAPK